MSVTAWDRTAQSDRRPAPHTFGTAAWQWMRTVGTGLVDAIEATGVVEASIDPGVRRRAAERFARRAG